MIVKRMFSLYIIGMFFLCITNLAYADQVHRVLPNETLSGIAKQYGITTDTLLGNNQYIINSERIYPGQVLIVPSSNKQAYLVKPGDTLFLIARQFGVSTEFLMDANQIANPNILYAGQILMVPKIYSVKAGDTLSKISLILGVNMMDLAVENNLADINKLSVGQPLIIPFQSREQEDLADVEKALSAIASRFPDTFYYKGTLGKRQVALTFDDGPGRTITPQVLDVLKTYEVQATFFLLGSNMPGNSEIVKRAVAEGHIIGNHTWFHPDIRTLGEVDLRNEMSLTETKITEVTGLQTVLMRPPYGFASDRNLQQLSGMGYKVIKWSVDSNDWRDRDVDQVLINTMPDVRDGSIILMHDYLTHSTTKEALPEIIQSLKRQGYTFVTIDELLDINAYK